VLIIHVIVICDLYDVQVRSQMGMARSILHYTLLVERPDLRTLVRTSLTEEAEYHPGNQ
jgi:hypothetical protein